MLTFLNLFLVANASTPMMGIFGQNNFGQVYEHYIFGFELGFYNGANLIRVSCLKYFFVHSPLQKSSF